MNSLLLFLFATTAGFTASGIVASLYRIAGLGGKGTGNQVVRAIIMIVAGPTVLFETAMRGYIAKAWTPLFFWGVTAVVMYWSLALGLFVLQLALSR
jgi:hypothetical protein